MSFLPAPTWDDKVHTLSMRGHPSLAEGPSHSRPQLVGAVVTSRGRAWGYPRTGAQKLSHIDLGDQLMMAIHRDGVRAMAGHQHLMVELSAHLAVQHLQLHQRQRGQIGGKIIIGLHPRAPRPKTGPRRGARKGNRFTGDPEVTLVGVTEGEAWFHQGALFGSGVEPDEVLAQQSVAHG